MSRLDDRQRAIHFPYTAICTPFVLSMPALESVFALARCFNCNVDFKKFAHKGIDFSDMASKERDVSHLIGMKVYIDFKALGFKGDPIIHGGISRSCPWA